MAGPYSRRGERYRRFFRLRLRLSAAFERVFLGFCAASWPPLLWVDASSINSKSRSTSSTKMGTCLRLVLAMIVPQKNRLFRQNSLIPLEFDPVKARLGKQAIAQAENNALDLERVIAE